ncbi:hypothetical protein C8N24_3689 [Solirubrobacter pauli]|uniref:Carboxymuconolactone decarboxylase family protein n=1 Tax=Solirubrobacter pauli TaxID=166793 RepID=A0A660LHS4_9ACTN|nr:hypothetical protein [Solirubrobacter pauli]RKQ93815.1 hypothetical protein C8N24_3689 [Solirubrobacter pauli]
MSSAFPTHWRHDIRPWRLLARLAAEPELGETVNAQGRLLSELMDARVLELIALRVSAVVDVEYVWRAHAFLSTQRLAVLSPDEVARVTLGADAFAGDDADLLRAVDEILAGGLSAASRATLGSDAVRVTIATGFYALVGALMRDAGPEDDIPSIAGLETPSAARRTGSPDAEVPRVSDISASAG